ALASGIGPGTWYPSDAPANNTPLRWDFDNDGEVNVHAYYNPQGPAGSVAGAWWCDNFDLFAPTYGENASVAEMADQRYTYIPGFGTGLPARPDWQGLGGDYWNVPYPIGIDGNWYISSYDARHSRSQLWGSFTNGSNSRFATGNLYSPTFSIGGNQQNRR